MQLGDLFCAAIVERLGEIRPVIDPFLLDKKMDTYRRGNRTLSALADQYGVALDDAHSSAADAVATALLVPRITAKFPELVEYSIDARHDAQQLWRREQQLTLADYFERQGIWMPFGQCNSDGRSALTRESSPRQIPNAG